MCEGLLPSEGSPLWGTAVHSPVSRQGFEGRKHSQTLLTLLGVSIFLWGAKATSSTWVTYVSSSKLLAPSVRVPGLKFLAALCTLQLCIRLLKVKSKSKE